MSALNILKKKRPNQNGIPLIHGKTEAEFIQDLKKFHSSRSTPFTAVPLALGRPINLLRLFNVVAAKGGFEKVSQRKLWPDVIQDMRLPTACSNGVHILRSIYLRFLESFEKSRDPAARHDTTEETWLEAMGASDASMRRRLGLNTLTTTSALNVVPMVHRGCRKPAIPVETRQLVGMSCQFREERAFRLLEMGLMSGLPNEVDVVLNSILLLSARSAVDIMQNPNILNLLLATVGIYDTGCASYYPLHEDWFIQTRRNFFRYWYENVDDPEFRVYLSPDAITNEKARWVDSESELHRRAMDALFNQTMELDDVLTEADVVGSRVESVATILRNLLVDSVDNLGAPSAINCLASCSSCVLRFAMLATGHSRDPSIHRLGLELLSVLRPSPVMRGAKVVARHYGFLLRRYLIESKDRVERLRGLEMLTRVCESALFSKDPSYAHPLLGISDKADGSASAELLAAAADCLLLRDLHLLIGGLEALLALSCLDEVVCRQLCEAPLGLLPILMALLTLEAPSLGQDSLLRLRIFQPLLPPVPPPHLVPVGRPTVPPQYYDPRMHAAARPPPQTVPVAQPSRLPPRPVPPREPPAPVVPASRRSLRFVVEWLRATFAATEHARVSRLQMFAEYRQAHQVQFAGAAAQAHGPVTESQFFELVKENFPNVEETTLRYPNGSVGVMYVNIGHASQAKGGHPPNGIRHGLAPPNLPCSANLPPSPPGSSDGPLVARPALSSTARLARAPPTPPHSPNHTPPPPQASGAAPAKAHVRQCLRNNLLERSRRLKERSLQQSSQSAAAAPVPGKAASPTPVTVNGVYETPSKRARMEESAMLVAGPAEVHGAAMMPDQVTLRRVPNPKSPAPVVNGAPPTPTPPPPPPPPPPPQAPLARPSHPHPHPLPHPHSFAYNRHLNARLQAAAFNRLWVRHLPPMLNPDQPKVAPVLPPGGDPASAKPPQGPLNGFRKPHPPPLADNVICNGTATKRKKAPEEAAAKEPAAAPPLVNGDHREEEEEDDEEEEEVEERRTRRSAKMKLKKRPISPGRGRGRGAHKRWSRKPKPSRAKCAQARYHRGALQMPLLLLSPSPPLRSAELEAQREILRQLPGWVEEGGSASDTSEDDGPGTGQSTRTVLGLRCEWADCATCFETPAQVFSHVFKRHFADASPTTARRCLWAGCTEGAKQPLEPARGLYSLLTHICEHHCSSAALTAALQRRREAALRGTVLPAPEPPPEDEETAVSAAAAAAAPTEVVGGISAAALSCLLRFQHDTLVRQAAMESDCRGPVTRHVRLTAALVLRNLATHCPEIVKRHLAGHASHLAQLALSNLDSSRVILHLLNALDEEEGLEEML